jgi:hypothetical protein
LKYEGKAEGGSCCNRTQGAFGTVVFMTAKGRSTIKRMLPTGECNMRFTAMTLQSEALAFAMMSVKISERFLRGAIEQYSFANLQRFGDSPCGCAAPGRGGAAVCRAESVLSNDCCGHQKTPGGE